MDKKIDNLNFIFDVLLEKIKSYFKQNSFIVFALLIAAVCGYGFELFNFNLTIDEEIHATYSSAVVAWVTQGRWGMYILNKLFFPHTVIPFAPLFAALVFHIAAALLLFEGWNIKSDPIKIIAGMVFITFPIISYMYTFSTINYGIGAGLFLVAMSLFLYAKLEGKLRLFAVIPAAFSLGIYQGFLPALIVAYLVHILSSWIRSGPPKIGELITVAGIHILSVAIYGAVQKTILTLGVFQESDYISQYIDIKSIIPDIGTILSRIWGTMVLVYTGGQSLYGINISYLKFFVLLLLLGFIIQVLRTKLALGNKVLIVFLGFSLLFIPFLSGIILQGYLAMRFLVALPVMMMGLTALGMGNAPRLYKVLTAFMALYCIFQFIVSTNNLFGSSHLALQSDRVLASRLFERIDLERSDKNVMEVKYLEVVGYYSNPSTPLIPKNETFGASFFEWDQGHAGRIVLFFKTLGYDDLQAAPMDKRIQMLNYVDSMPAWPEQGSIKIIDGVVLIKFGPYSATQKLSICNSIKELDPPKYKEFCK